MSFDLEDCAIPTVYCGKGTPPKRSSKEPLKYYYKIGNRYECMRKGFGSGYNKAKKENLPKGSLQNISYVGEVYEKKFKSNGISNITQLLTKTRGSSKAQNKTFLTKVFMRKKGGLDKRAYNSTIVYLFQNGVDVSKLPVCSKITKP